MPSRFDLLVFDWDGTLMDSTAHIVAAIQFAFGEMGLTVPTKQAASHIIGLGLVDALRHLDPALPAEDYGKLAAAYRRYYLDPSHVTPLFDGVLPALEAYREAGFYLAVATGKSRAGLNQAMASAGVAHLFDWTRCADETFSKPHPAMLEEILDFLGVDRTRALMIGDTTHDLQMAMNARCAGVGVSYGAHPKEELLALSPLACADHFSELDLWIRQNA